jgi:integration host factor subunit alpha
VLEMTKEDIVTAIWSNLDITKRRAGEIVDHLLDTIKGTLEMADNVKIGGFGKFEVRHRKRRVGRNPKTGEEKEIKEGKSVKFTAGKPLKNAVMGKMVD